MKKITSRKGLDISPSLLLVCKSDLFPVSDPQSAAMMSPGQVSGHSITWISYLRDYLDCSNGPVSRSRVFECFAAADTGASANEASGHRLKPVGVREF